MKPPLLARLLLASFAGENEAVCVAGDLEEEFAWIAETRGRSKGKRWYWGQVIRSAPALFALQMRPAGLAQLLARSFLGMVLPLLLIDRIWTYVYSQIPLKDGTERAPLFLAANVLCACLLARLSAPPSLGAALGALAAAASAGFAMWASTGDAPAAYIVAILLAAQAGTFLRRRLA